MDSTKLRRKRSTSTLANTVSFTHTRSAYEEDLRSPVSSQFPPILPTNTARSNTVSGGSPFAYLNRNGSSSTVSSITHTLSNVGFTPVVPQADAMSNYSPVSNTSGNTSPIVGQKREGKFQRAKTFARAKTKEALTRAKTDTSLDHHGSFGLKPGHLHHHHLLSSSSSNSRVVGSGSTLYSFDPTQLNDMGKDSQIGLHTQRLQLSQEEKEHVADSAWHTLATTVSPLFVQSEAQSWKGRCTIEEANSIVTTWMRLRIESGVASPTLIRELTEFLKQQFHMLQSSLPQDLDHLQRLALTWQTFFKEVYHYLLAVFQPLDDELNGVGHLTQRHKAYWSDSQNTSVKKLILESFRDAVVFPAVELNPVLPPVAEKDRRVLVQCFGMIKTVRGSSTASYAQRVVEQVSGVLEQQL